MRRRKKRASTRRKNGISPKRRRQKRIVRLLWLVLLLEFTLLAGICVKRQMDIRQMRIKEEEGMEQAGAFETEQTGELQTDETEESGDPALVLQTDSSGASQGTAEEARQEIASETGDASASETISHLNKDLPHAENTATEASHKTNGLAICMYHYIYDKNDPPKDEINTNFIEVHALEEELQYLKENNYYFPTWQEVQQYVKGELLLPEKSVVLTFDDGAKTFLKYGPELFAKYEIPVTSFLIGKNEGESKVSKYANDYLTFQSHSYNMHRGGGNIGHGGIFPVMSHDDALADLQKSVEICGNGDAFAYPYGDYNDSCRQAVADAGFFCAVTTENRRAQVGDDPLLLPRVRMCHGQSLKSFISLVQ